MRPNEITPERKKFNFNRFQMLTNDHMKEQLAEVYAAHEEPFKVKLSFRYILRHNKTDMTKYFYPEQNVWLFNRAFPKSKYKDILKLRIKIQEIDEMEQVQQQRPDTKHQAIAVTNVLYMTYSITDFKLGVDDSYLPKYILDKRCIVLFHLDNRQKSYPYIYVYV